MVLLKNPSDSLLETESTIVKNEFLTETFFVLCFQWTYVCASESDMHKSRERHGSWIPLLRLSKAQPCHVRLHRPILKWILDIPFRDGFWTPLCSFAHFNKKYMYLFLVTQHTLAASALTLVDGALKDI